MGKVNRVHRSDAPLMRSSLIGASECGIAISRIHLVRRSVYA